MRNFLIPGFLIVAGLLLMAGCNNGPEHQVEMSPPPMPPRQAETQPKLKEIRPLDNGETQIQSPRKEAPPTITEVTSQEKTSTKTYHVQRGETFWKIAAKELGNGQRWREISKLNPNVDPSKLKVGQTILIPSK